MELGLLLLRLLLGAILFMHATQKLFGWFSGPGLDKAAGLFDSLGQRPGRAMARLAALSELAGTILIVLGLAAPLGAAIVTGTMLVAGLAMTGVKGTVWSAAGGGEYPLVLAAVAAVLGFTGPGGWSLDAALSAPWSATGTSAAALTGVLALAVAVVAAIPPLLRGRLALRRTTQVNDRASAA
ncbi:MAG TPA: DoxX family protein [Amycolatopsis sp.]|nr:DoxX family protein [Amycolatopsis sp.]